MTNEAKIVLTASDKTQAAFKSATASFDALGNVAKGALAGFGAAEFTGKLISVQREFDGLNASLITMTGSSAAAAREFAWIKEFAATTPFSLNEVTSAFVKMKSLGLDATEASLASYGNTASAMGKSLTQFIEAVADASTGEFERLKEFGIKASKSGEDVSLTFQGVTTKIGNNAEAITGYLAKIGNNEFAGAMAERAKTLDGALSNLGDTWDELFRTINQGDAGGLITQGVKLASAAITDAIAIIKSLSAEEDAAATSTDTFAAAQNGLRTVFETVAILGMNVKYVLVQIGNELGGLAAQAAAIASLDFKAAGAIGDMMKQDAAAARAALDAAEKRVFNARQIEQDKRGFAALSDGLDPPPKPRKGGGGGGADDKPKKSGKTSSASYSDYDALLTERIAAALEKTDIAKADELAATLKKLDEIAAIGLDPALIKSVRDDLTGASKTAADEVERLNRLLDDTPSAALEKTRADMELLTAALEAGRISEEKYLEATTARLSDHSEKLKEETDIARELGLTFTSSFENAVASGGKFSNILKGLEQDLIKLLVRLTVTEPAMKAIAGINWGSLASGLFGGSSTSSSTNYLGSGQSLNTSAGSTLRLPSYAVGTDYVPQDMIAMVHKGERIVPAEYNPLNGAAGQGSNVVVNVINNTDSKASTQQRSDGKGGKIIDILIEQVKGSLAGDVASGNGAFPAALQSTYGLSRGAGAY